MTNCAPAVATFSAFCSRVYLDNLIGNDVTSSQPISDDTPSSLTTLRGRVDSIIAAFAGWTVFTSDTTYREYSGVTTSSPNDGSLPYNQQIMWPAILADNPDCYDANTGVSRINLYSWGIFNRNWLMAGDPVHYSDYSTYRAELVRAMEGRVRNGQWPDSYALMLVKRLETERLYHLKREAGYVVNSLPASATKTALQARVDAVTNLLPSRMRISHGPDANAPPVPWTNSARTTAGVAITDIVTEDGFKTSYVWNISLAGNGAFSFGAQGAAQGAEFPDSALLGYLSDTIDSMAVKLTGADASERYRIKAMGSRSGTGTRLQDFVAGGVTQSVNVLGNLSTVADFADLAPTVGEIEMTINRGVGNTTGVYLNGVVVEVLPAQQDKTKRRGLSMRGIDDEHCKTITPTPRRASKVYCLCSVADRAPLQHDRARSSSQALTGRRDHYPVGICRPHLYDDRRTQRAAAGTGRDPDGRRPAARRRNFG